jgi:hypothetical protein
VPGTAHVGDEITYTINTAVTDTPADFSVLVQFPTGVQASDRLLAGGVGTVLSARRRRTN